MYQCPWSPGRPLPQAAPSALPQASGGQPSHLRVGLAPGRTAPNTDFVPPTPPTPPAAQDGLTLFTNPKKRSLSVLHSTGEKADQPLDLNPRGDRSVKTAPTVDTEQS